LPISSQRSASGSVDLARELTLDVETNIARYPRQSQSLLLRADLAPDCTEHSHTTRYRNPRVSVESRPLAPLAPGHLRLRMLRVGICGTDLHLLEQSADGLIRCTSPVFIPEDGRIIGHEGIGVVEVVGPESGHLVRGDIVCCESITTCGICPRCRRGNFNQCDQAKLIGLEQDGLFAEWADIPARVAHCVNDLATSKAILSGLACVEPAAVAFLACQNARVSPGDSVLVLGGGPIGYYAAHLANKVFGASYVCLSEPSDFRRDFARKVCDAVTTPEELPYLRRRFDVVIEAAGALEQLDQLLPRINGNGRIVLLARTAANLAITGVHYLISKSLHVIGSRGHLGGAFDAILSLTREGRLDLRQVVTRVISGLDEMSDVLRDPEGLVASECKVIAELSE
jgi:(R,R)-butanediol dehydrogenase / meso-butanediol dehydrogenase / diacetyl reductase